MISNLGHEWPSMSGPTDAPPPSSLADKNFALLQEVMEFAERGSGMKMSFDDLTGFNNGAHVDVPAMHLDSAHQFHSCDYCQLTKMFGRGRDCIRNKVAVNRLVLRRKVGLNGLCHLGMFDIAEPVIVSGRVIGVLYYGSVVVRGQEARSEMRIRRYSNRMGYDPDFYLNALKKVPRIDEHDIAQHRQTLRTVARLAQFFFETSGVRAELYKLRPLRYPYQDPQDIPYVVREAMAYIKAHLQEPFIVKDLADHLNYHPDVLGRKFKQALGVELSQYLLQARVDRAKRLLANPKLTIEDVAELCGFSDRFHFSRAFRRIVGVPPGKFKEQLA
jgi:AraC-like DNA-binding protein/ligand-binding sensor protein